jgi:hypothetical protein
MKIFIISDFLFCIDVIPPLSKHVKTLVPFSYLPSNLRWVKDQSTQEMVRCAFFESKRKKRNRRRRWYASLAGSLAFKESTRASLSVLSLKAKKASEK